MKETTRNIHRHKRAAGKDEDGIIRYVGITKREPYIRFDEHYNSGTNRAALQFEVVKGTGSLSRIQARIIEQRLINAYGMKKYGGALFNLRNEIGHQHWFRYGIINN